MNLIGFRRHGHNELDDPRFTQPLMYKIIDAEPSISDTYAKQLQEDGTVEGDFAEKCRNSFLDTLDKALKRVDARETKPV